MSSALTKKDFKTDQEVRWCPGCGDYSILNSVQSVFAEMGVERSRTVIVSGIGCSSRFPYYMNTYGFHSIHGRAPAVATGVKVANPDLEVWVATGDGDALSIGGNHLLHALRRNVGLKILMFNNRIYGLTKGQFSPTSLVGQVTKSTPVGVVDHPFNPIAVALGAGATFVARTIDVMAKHLQETVRAAAAHKGSAFIEVYQNCNIFNDNAFAHITDKEVRDDRLVDLRAGKPLLFGKNMTSGLRLKGFDVEAVKIGEGVGPDDCIVFDPTAQNPGLAFALAQMPEDSMPTPIGVFRNVSRPAFEDGIQSQIKTARQKGEGDLAKLLYAGDIWDVR